ncbi:MAG: annexin, partial [Candidatus Obscuribacterales bacterium]|nr:annexin [Candidatus Obscuribacterales bacterium]
VNDLDKAWKDNGSQPPMYVTVRINAEHTGMGQPLDGNAATHAVSITHIEYGPDGKPSQVFYENTAKPSDDHSYPNGKPVPADEFVKSMQGERSNQYKDGTVDHWKEPLTATVRTDGKAERQIDSEKSKELDRAVAEFRDSTHKDAFIDYGTDRKEMEHALKDRPRWEIEEMNRRYKAQYGKSIDEDIMDELDGADRRKFRGMLKGTDTKTDDAPLKR